MFLSFRGKAGRQAVHSHDCVDLVHLQHLQELHHLGAIHICNKDKKPYSLYIMIYYIGDITSRLQAVDDLYSEGKEKRFQKKFTPELMLKIY